jgi:thiamine monophosphate kinase
LGDGEDFELLFACVASQASAMMAAWRAAFPELPLTRIGRLVESGCGETLAGGWDHFGPQVS